MAKGFTVKAKTPVVTEPEWDAVLPLEKEHVDNLVKAKNALTGVGSMTLSIDKDLNGDDMCLFTFGDEQGHNNKITYQMYGTIKQEKAEIPFNSDMFRNILKENKDLESGNIYLSYQGLMKIEFKSDFENIVFINFARSRFTPDRFLFS